MIEEIGVEGVNNLRETLRFGDIVVNHWASDGNKHKTGVFVKINKKSLLVTDMKGDFWQPVFDSKSKLEVIGSIFNSSHSLF